MRPYILAETNWKAVKETRYDLAVLPWGATEAHNFHLPYGTDIFESELISAEAARICWEKDVKIIVLPGLPFGVNTGQMDIPLTINLNPSTQQLVLKDVLSSLQAHKITKLLIVNSHGGNDFKQIIRELGIQFPNMLISTCNWYKSVDKSSFFENEGDHADEMETSLMLHIAPQLVLPLTEAGDGASKKSKVQAINEGWAWVERKWSQISADTGVGDPRKGTKEKGERYFTQVTEKLSRLMIDLANIDKNNMYV